MKTVPATAELLAHRLEDNAAPAGAEVVVLLNGGMMSLSAWEPTAAELREGYRLLRCDFRGQLLSPGPTHRVLEGHADDVVTLLDALELDRVHVLGVSFGAEVGLIVAGRNPERVASLIAATAGDRATESMRRGTGRLREVLDDLRAGGDRGRFHDVLVEEVFSPEWVEKYRPLLAERRRQIARLPDEWFAGLEGILDATVELDVTPYLGAIRCPTLVIVAGRDAVFPPEHGRELARAIPGAELAEHPSAGHTLVIEDADWFNTTCRDFLDRTTSDSPWPTPEA